MKIGKYLAVALGTAVLCVLVIYLTPLKHLNLITPSMREIDPKALYNDMQTNPSGYIFIDVRDADVYDGAHAQGAVNIPIADLVTMNLGFPRSGKQIAFICTTGQLATVAYGYLQNLGFMNILHVTGGLEQWNAEGLPIAGKNVVNGIDSAPMLPDGANDGSGNTQQ